MGKIEHEALFTLGYGLYVISSNLGDKLSGQIANVVFQVTSQPIVLGICINKKNLTHEFIEKSRSFSVSVLEQDTPMTFIGKFGFKSGRDIDKFIGTSFETGETGVLIVTDFSVSYMEVKVVSQLDAGTHTVYLGELVSSKLIKDATPMTYAYYHEVKKGKSPKSAPTYFEQKK